MMPGRPTSVCRVPTRGNATSKRMPNRGKRGTKRSLLTDAAGIPVGQVVDGANRNDFKLTRATLTSIGDGVITTDAEGRVTFLNPVARSLTVAFSITPTVG